MDNVCFTVVDIETTGLSKTSDRITEVAAVKLYKGKIIDEFHSLVNPEKHIPSFITRLTGIDDKMVKDSPTINPVIKNFIDFLEDDIIVAHNATFDYGFLSYNAYLHHNVQLWNKKVCTRKLANRLIPQLPSKKLACLCEHFSIENDQAHRAMSDVKATTEIFLRFLQMLKENNISKFEDVYKLQNMPASKIRF